MARAGAALLIWSCLLGACLLYARDGMAADSYQPGFRTLGQWSVEDGHRLDMNVWYPCSRNPREFFYAPWTIRVARNAAPVPGRFPLILLSHASPGNRFSYHELCAWLASCGFVVAAPTHAKDCMNNMDLLFSWQQLENRVQDLEAAIRFLLRDKGIAGSIDQNRIGILGFGTGATAALIIGGALPDCSDWPSYCAKAGAGDIYCNAWAKEKINGMCSSFPLRKSLANPRIRAIAAVSPGYGMLFGKNSFKYFYPPLLLADAEKDEINRPALHGARIAQLLGGKCHYIVVKGADEGALMSACPGQLASELPDMCLSVSDDERHRIHTRLREALADFFLHHLGNSASLPTIPDPPDLSPEKPATPLMPRKRKPG